MSRNAKYSLGAVVVVATAFALAWAAYKSVPRPDSEMIIHGNRELAWEVPVDASSRSASADLAGYKIYCWNAEDRQSETIVIQDPQTTRYKLDQLWPGTYQCALSAIRSDGSQSALSNVVVRTIP